jgi:hypothetical protein
MRWWIILAALALGGCGGGDRDGPQERRPRADPVAAKDVFRQGPYLGVSCPAANSIGCDRVGLAVWLKHPAESVTAEIGGRELALDDPDASRSPRLFAGFLQDAGLTKREGPLALRVSGDYWDGGEGRRPAPEVRFTIRHEGGRPLTTTVAVPLHAGWG